MLGSWGAAGASLEPAGAAEMALDEAGAAEAALAAWAAWAAWACLPWIFRTAEEDAGAAGAALEATGAALEATGAALEATGAALGAIATSTTSATTGAALDVGDAGAALETALEAAGARWWLRRETDGAADEDEDEARTTANRMTYMGDS